MLKFSKFCKIAIALFTLAIVATFSTISRKTRLIGAEPAGRAPSASDGRLTAHPSIPAADLISTQDLVKTLQSPQGERPLLIYVGFRIPYGQGHIPNSEYFGPAANPAVVQQLRKRVDGLPRNRFIVLYCGCCPWIHCPNVEPAYDGLHDLRFTKLKVLYIPSNLGTDWVDKGYPVEKGE